MKYEMKICLPVYKIVYSICFVIMLSLVRGITDVVEIGIVLDAFMAVLAGIFCADTLQMEYTGKRWEVFSLYPVKYRLYAMWKRMAVQWVYLCLLSVFGYGCFFWQQPRNMDEGSEIWLFFITIAAVSVSVLFFGMTAFTFASLCRSSLAGIGISIIVWLVTYSAWGERVLGNGNIFAFVFRNTKNGADTGWIFGKGIAVLLVVFMVLADWMMRKKKGKCENIISGG
ncbi:MAG: ABC transporter permease [Lachnospiraceae bacterium]|nr:ABC transporter permease [Lachnospiraceae bacterium]